MRAPPFPLGLDWFNSPPLTWEKLRGKVVLLDFWTFCCINCMHTLPDIAWLLSKYKGEAVACIGVHSAKFSNEKVGAHVRDAMQRYGVRHPVVNDPEMVMWEALGVRAWPSLALIDPDGQVIELLSGEGHRDELDRKIARLLSSWPPDQLDKSPLPLTPEVREESILRYPGKVAHHPTEERLFISDSGHHRLLIVDSKSGEIIQTIGSGVAGLKDFHSPQGLAYRSNKIYLADTGNHRIRLIDLKEERVTTLEGPKLSSPWDLSLVGHCLYIAMAGSHQIWLYDLLTSSFSLYSGTGAELHLNSSHPRRSCWAQPSGITFGQGMLYIADSESSAIRSLDPVSRATQTLAGGDPSVPQNLFAFGDRDGVGSGARLQHPLGLIWWEQRRKIIVADSYNHRLKLLDPATGEVASWIGSGASGHQDGVGLSAQFSEPSGLALSPDGQRLFVADTNNGAIRLIETGSKRVSTLQIRGG